MIAEDDRLYAGMCYSDCGHWGAYQRVAIDLRVNRATLVGTDDGIEDETRPSSTSYAALTIRLEYRCPYRSEAGDSSKDVFVQHSSLGLS